MGRQTGKQRGFITDDCCDIAGILEDYKRVRCISARREADAVYFPVFRDNPREWWEVVVIRPDLGGCPEKYHGSIAFAFYRGIRDNSTRFQTNTTGLKPGTNHWDP